MNKITRNIAALIAFGIGTTTIGFAQVTQQKIGNNPTIISPSAVIEVESTNKGALLPRVALTSLTDVVTINNPADALTVFNTATDGVTPNDVKPGYYYWSATENKWIRLTDQEADLRVVGNANHITQDAGVGSNGTDAGTGTGNILIGQNAGAASNLLNRDNNIMIGADAGIDAQTQEVVAIGWLAAPKLGTASGGDFDPGIYIGAFAGSEQNTILPTSGSQNTVIGTSAGRNGQNLFSTIVGHSAGSGANGENNVLLGASAGYSINSNNNIIIGTSINPLDNNAGNQLNIGNWIYGDDGNIAIGNVNPTEKFDVTSGNVRVRDINLPANLGDVATDRIVVADAQGVLKTVDQSSLTPTTINDLSSNANTMISLVNGVSDDAPIVNSNALSLSGTELTSTVNGVASTAVDLTTAIEDATTNVVTTTANTLTSVVNGVSDDAPIINTNALSLSGTNLTSTVNGVPSTALDVSSLAIEPWQEIGGTDKATSNTQNIYQKGNVAIGATTAPSFLVGATTVQPKLHIAGDVSTTGKYYTTNSVYADYVFEKYFNGSSNINPNYEFKSLNYVKEFIKANNHLPGVESINDLAKAENGYTFDMTKLTIQSLEKIEELYLHTIEQQDKIDTQQEEIQLLKKQVQETDERLQRLENILVD